VLASLASAATDFTLDDQFRKAHARADIFAGKPVIMLAGIERMTPEWPRCWRSSQSDMRQCADRTT